MLSGTTASAVEAALPAGVSLRALGEHRLKDLKPERLWDVAIAGLRSDFPPIRSLDARPNNLPTQLTAFVGRERELDEARELLLRSRLLTLTGPGGTGKTRLSLQLAGSVMEAFPGGIWFVPLANVTDPSLVLATIAHAVGIPETPGRRPLDALADAARGEGRPPRARQPRAAGRCGRRHRGPAADAAPAHHRRLEPGRAAHLGRAGIRGRRAGRATRPVAPEPAGA